MAKISRSTHKKHVKDWKYELFTTASVQEKQKEYYEEYRKAGIETEPFLNWHSCLTSRINYRNHRKIVVIDGRIGYVGGMNVADRYIHGFEWGNWRDTHARIEGKGVQGLQSAFLIDWYFVSQTLITSRKYFPALGIYGNNPMQIVDSGPLKEENGIPFGILQAIYNAKNQYSFKRPISYPLMP